MPVNYDYPIPLDGKMAKVYLWQIEQDARRLRQGLGDQDQLPGWVNAYVYTSADRLQAASRYMQYQFKQPSYGDVDPGVKTLGPVLAIVGVALTGWLLFRQA